MSPAERCPGLNGPIAGLKYKLLKREEAKGRAVDEATRRMLSADPTRDYSPAYRKLEAIFKASEV